MDSDHRLNFPANPLSFIKIILSKNTIFEKIKVPNKFTEKHGDDLQDKVILKLPNDDVWKVDLLKSKGDILFSNGWNEFVEHYDLKFGYLLMFMYQGFSVFRVTIFDPSACEIVYPINRIGLGSCIKAEFDDTKTCSLVDDRDHDQESEIEIIGESSSKKVKRGETTRTLEAVKASFKSNKPFFMAYINPFHIEGRANLQIPVKFIEQNWSGFKRDQKCVLKLGGKTWETSTCNRALRLGGWKIFMKDNGVSVSDICVFELIDEHTNLLKVSIIRGHRL